MELTEREQEILIGFIGQWLDEVGDNDNNDLTIIYNKLTGGQKPCVHCGIKIDEEVWEAELGMCLTCSNVYFAEDE
jgi:hypothetical protein